MSKTLLIIGGSVAGTAVVAGGAATGIVISQQNSANVESNTLLNRVKAKIEADNKLDKSQSANTIYPNGTGTKLDENQIKALGLESTFEGYSVTVTVDSVSANEVTFNVTLNKEGEAEQTIKVNLLGFASTNADAQALAALVNSVNGKVFEVKDTTEYVQTLTKDLSDKSVADQLALILAKNDLLNEQKSAFEKFTTELSNQSSITSSGAVLSITAKLVSGSVEENISFTLSGLLNGESALKTKATAVAGDYVVINSISTKDFVEQANLNTLVTLVTGLSEKLTTNKVTLVSVTPQSVLDTATAVVFKVLIKLDSTNLESETTISVIGLKAVSQIADEEAQTQLDAVITKVKGQTYSINDTTTSVNEFITEASAGTIASLISNEFKTALGNAEVSTIEVSAKSDNSKAVSVVATLKIGEKSATTTFNVDGLVSNNLAEANALLESASKAIDGKSFASKENTFVSSFIEAVNKSTIESLLDASFNKALNGASISSLNARVSATNKSVVNVELVLVFAGTEATKVVSFTVSNLKATPTEAEHLNALVEDLQAGKYTVTNATSTDDFASNVSKDNIKTLVSGIEAKLSGLSLIGVSVGGYNDAATSVALTLTVTLENSDLSASAIVTINGLTSTDEVDKAKEASTLETIVKAISDKSFAVLDTNMTVSQFKNSANATTITSLVNGALQNALGTSGKINELTISTNSSNTSEVNVVAKISVRSASQSVSFKVSGLESDQKAAANIALNNVATSLNESAFNAKTNVEANVFAKTVSSSNIQSLLNATFIKDLASASVSVVSATVVGTNRDNVQIKLTLGHANTDLTKDVVIKVTNLSPAPESETAQTALDTIVNNINNKTFASQNAIVNSTFVDEVSSNPASLSTLLGTSFANAIKGATISALASHVGFDANNATEVTLNVVLSYPQANNRTVAIKVYNLVTAKTAANLALQKVAQNVATQLSNRTVAVASKFTGLNTSAFQNKLKTDFANTIPSAILTSFGSAKVSLKSISFVPITGNTVSVSLSVIAYSGAPEITVSNLTLSGLVPYGVNNGISYVNNALEVAVKQSLDKWSNVVPKTYSNLEADRFASTVLVSKGSSTESKLNSLAQVLNLSEAQVKAISELKISIPSLISTNKITYDFAVEYTNNVGSLYLIAKADTTGPSWVNGNETDIRYETSVKVSLAKYISFKAGHYQSVADLVSQANKTKYEIENRKTAQEWVEYYKPSWQYKETPNYDAKVMLLWMSVDTKNDLLKTIYEKASKVTINAFTVNSPYSFTLSATIVDYEGQTSKLNVTFDSQAPEYTNIYTGLSVFNNYDLTFLFSRNVKTQQKALADVIRLHGGSRSSFADVVSNFKNLKSITYKAASSDSRDNVIFTLTSNDGKVQKIALQFQDLQLAPIKNWIQTAETAQAFELITKAKWLRTQSVVYPGLSPDSVNWTKGEDYLVKLFFYRNDSIMNVESWFNRANGVQSVQLLVKSGDYIKNYGNKFSRARFNFEMVGFDGVKVAAFEHEYVLQYFDTHYFGAANWNDPNWDSKVPASAWYSFYADLLVNGISVGYIG